VRHDPRALLEALAATLDGGEVLARFPGLSRDELRRILREAARLFPDGFARLPGGHGAHAAAGAGAPTAAAQLPWPAVVVAHVDGAARGNPGAAGAGVLLSDEAGEPLERIARYLGRATNNTAEYQALLIALGRAREAGVRHLKVFSDSELLVNQVNGRYRTSAPHLQRYLQEAIRLMREIGRVDVRHVRREQNAEADALANEAIDKHKT
jgi:ribonuclease HI